jgi:N-acetylglucosaminyldiphosphoundecaprenol N-acetyl-beta-D-mannosaminyltransferase
MTAAIVPGTATVPTGVDARLDGVRTRRMFRMDFVDDVDVHTTVRRLLDPQPEAGEPVVFTPNVDTIVRLPELEPGGVADRLRDARYTLPDGQPIVWLSRLLRRPLRARLAGSDLVPPLWRRIVADGRRAMVVASCDELAATLRAEHPTLATYVPPVFDRADPAALAAVASAAAAVVDRADPEFVFVGISCPKQQLLAFALIDHLRRQGRTPPLFLLIGGAFDMYAGRTRRAPAWVQRLGAEWFFRFLLEPRRLFRRYFVDDVRFLAIAAGEIRRSRVAGGRRGGPPPVVGQRVRSSRTSATDSPQPAPARSTA